MRKRLRQHAVKVTTLIKLVKLDTILPFPEKPSVEEPASSSTTTTTKEKKNNLGASDLFSLFTADIIKQQVIFTR